MPFPRRLRTHQEIVNLVARDVLGLSIRPRAMDVLAEDLLGIPHPLLELDRSHGIGPQRLSPENVMPGMEMSMQGLPPLPEMGMQILPFLAEL